ncbi:MAG: hypothetical protein OEL81_01600 [Nitrosopumilus sp.]|nr:hypothetical protein [Nitrosopumilus sp.]
MKCTNICQTFKIKKPSLGSTRYGSGQKYCSYCEIFMNINNNRCPCCKYMLKTRSSKRRDDGIVKRM